MNQKRLSLIRMTLTTTLVFLIAFGLAQTANAFEEDDDGYIPKGEMINDDVIISHQEVIIDGSVNGDILASGGEVTINGTIEGNLIIYGGKATINGFVNGSVAFFGQQLEINSTINGTIYFAGAELILGEEAQINRNILFAGFSLRTLPGSLVGRDIKATGSQTSLNGHIMGSVNMDMSGIEISGKIDGDVDFNVSAPKETLPDVSWFEIWAEVSGIGVAPKPIPDGIRVSSETEIKGALSYQSPVEQSSAILSQPAGGVKFTQRHEPNTRQLGNYQWFLGKLQEFLTLLIFGAISLWQTPKLLKQAKQNLLQKPLPAAGYGVVTIVGGFSIAFFAGIVIIALGILISVVTLGGLAQAVFGIGFSSLSLIFSVFLLMLVYGSKLVVAFLGGEMMMNRFFPNQAHMKMIALLIGITIYSAFRLIPIVSNIVALLATTFGMGALFLVFITWKKEKKGSKSSGEQIPTVSDR
jgi:hypothetical protein